VSHATFGTHRAAVSRDVFLKVMVGVFTLFDALATMDDLAFLFR
jgi:hypothetical protein